MHSEGVRAETLTWPIVGAWADAPRQWRLMGYVVCLLLGGSAVEEGSLLSLENVGQHGAGRGQLTHLTQELGLGVFPNQTGSDGHRSTATHSLNTCKYVLAVKHSIIIGPQIHNMVILMIACTMGYII